MTNSDITFNISQYIKKINHNVTKIRQINFYGTAETKFRSNLLYKKAQPHFEIELNVSKNLGLCPNPPAF